MEFECRICGQREDTKLFTGSRAARLKRLRLCSSCLFWHDQKKEDETRRGPHGWAVIDGTHYVPERRLNTIKGFGGAKFRIRFADGHETECDNLWCQGDIPAGHWREQMPDNATFVNPQPQNP